MVYIEYTKNTKKYEKRANYLDFTWVYGQWRFGIQSHGYDVINNYLPISIVEQLYVCTQHKLSIINIQILLYSVTFTYQTLVC